MRSKSVRSESVRSPGAALGRSGGEFLAAMGAAAGQDLAATRSRHTRTEAVAALAHDFARLIGALHGVLWRKERGFYGSRRPLSTVGPAPPKLNNKRRNKGFCPRSRVTM